MYEANYSNGAPTVQCWVSFFVSIHLFFLKKRNFKKRLNHLIYLTYSYKQLSTISLRYLFIKFDMVHLNISLQLTHLNKISDYYVLCFYMHCTNF